MSIELKDKLYTSTQVADILGVSLRTLYRYMEDGKIQSMRTASGRHRFTKDQILDFLNAGGLGGVVSSYDRQSTKSQQVPENNAQTNDTKVSELEDVFTSPAVSASAAYSKKEVFTSGMDWLKESNEKTEEKIIETQNLAESTGITFNSVNEVEVSSKQSVGQAESKGETFVQFPPSIDNIAIEPKNESLDLNDVNVRYYKSDYSDLIELARKVKDTAMGKDLEYAFTLFAGLSLHFSIKPFTKLHFYANPEDMQIWKSELRLTPVQNRIDANIGVLVNTDIVFVPSKDIGGFKVVDDKVLMRDLSSRNEEELVKQFRQHLMST